MAPDALLHEAHGVARATKDAAGCIDWLRTLCCMSRARPIGPRGQPKMLLGASTEPGRGFGHPTNQLHREGLVSLAKASEIKIHKQILMGQPCNRIQRDPGNLGTNIRYSLGTQSDRYMYGNNFLFVGGILIRLELRWV
jgi:hypothetical protein